MQQIATYETVIRACESLKSEGQKVTGRAVKAITGGSLGTVLNYIKQWRENAAQTPTSLPSEISPELQAAILREVGFAQDGTAAKLKDQIDQAGARESEALDGLTRAESRIEDLSNELAEVRSQADRDRQEFEKIQAVLTEKVEALTQRAQDLETERRQLIETAEASRTETAKAQLQIERADQATGKAEAKVLDLEVELKRIVEEKTAAEKAQAVAEQRNSDQADTLNEIRATLAELKLRMERADQAVSKAEARVLDLESELKGMVEEKNAARNAQAVAEQRSTDQAETLKETRAALAELKSESKGAIAEHKKEIQDLRKKNAELEKHVAELRVGKA